MKEEIVLTAKHAGDIFSYDQDLKKQYLLLSKQFHPDVNSNPNATKAMAIVNSLYLEAQAMLEKGEWHETNCVVFSTTDGKRRKIKYLKTFSFELGKVLVSESIVCFLFDKDKEMYYNEYVKQTKSFKFASDRMKEQFTPILPKVLDKFQTLEGEFGVVVSKNPDEILLTDLLEYVKIVEDRHVAWILGSLYNLSCFFYFNGIVQNGITLDTVFVNPKTHAVSILGGWNYTKKIGEKMTGIKKDVYDLLPIKTKEDKLATHLADLESIRLIGRQLLGFKTMVESKKSSGPKSICSWLWSGSSET